MASHSGRQGVARILVSAKDSVSVGVLDRTVCIRVEGRGTFQNSIGLKQVIKQMIQRGYRDFVIDLKGCDLMDSTFMGTLAGAALRLRELGQGHLSVSNANPRSHDLLVGLGLDQLFHVSTKSLGSLPVTTSPVPSPAGESEDAGKQAVLEAHEALAAADAKNAVKFRDVIDFLRQDLGIPADKEDGSSES
ncbi:MAG: STAS domain-containing protein [Terrimicrobiaceae bacterium]